MQSIAVDDDVYTIIRKARQLGDGSDGDVLRRLLSEPKSQPRKPRQKKTKPKAGISQGLSTAMAAHQRSIDLNRRARAKQDLLSQDFSLGYEPPTGKATWLDDIRLALLDLGGHASLKEIYEEVKRRRLAAKMTVPKSFEATIRKTIGEHSKDSANYDGRINLFRKVQRSHWSLIPNANKKGGEPSKFGHPKSAISSGLEG